MYRSIVFNHSRPPVGANLRTGPMPMRLALGLLFGAVITMQYGCLSLDAPGTPPIPVENLLPNSDRAETLLNDGNAVEVAQVTMPRPVGNEGIVLKCAHVKTAPGYFRQGAWLPLVEGTTYTFSFFFKNEDVVAPYDKVPNDIGVGITAFDTFEAFGNPLATDDEYPDGWYRQRLTVTPQHSQDFQIAFSQTVNQAPIGSYYLFGFQFEQGDTLGPYTPHVDP